MLQLLLQGLNNKDRKILDSVLDRADEELIEKTVRRLPVEAVLPLITELQHYIKVTFLICSFKTINHELDPKMSAFCNLFGKAPQDLIISTDTHFPKKTFIEIINLKARLLHFLFFPRLLSFG